LPQEGLYGSVFGSSGKRMMHESIEQQVDPLMFDVIQKCLKTICNGFDIKISNRLNRVNDSTIELSLDIIGGGDCLIERWKLVYDKEEVKNTPFMVNMKELIRRSSTFLRSLYSFLFLLPSRQMLRKVDPSKAPNISHMLYQIGEGRERDNNVPFVGETRIFHMPALNLHTSQTTRLGLGARAGANKSILLYIGVKFLSNKSLRIALDVSMFGSVPPSILNSSHSHGNDGSGGYTHELGNLNDADFGVNADFDQNETAVAIDNELGFFEESSYSSSTTAGASAGASASANTIMLDSSVFANSSATSNGMPNNNSNNRNSNSVNNSNMEIQNSGCYVQVHRHSLVNDNYVHIRGNDVDRDRDKDRDNNDVNKVCNGNNSDRCRSRSRSSSLESIFASTRAFNSIHASNTGPPVLLRGMALSGLQGLAVRLRAFSLSLPPPPVLKHYSPIQIQTTVCTTVVSDEDEDEDEDVDIDENRKIRATTTAAIADVLSVGTGSSSDASLVTVPEDSSNSTGTLGFLLKEMEMYIQSASGHKESSSSNSSHINDSSGDR